jgi:hypothetical protein
MAAVTKCYQVFFTVVPPAAPELLVVDFEERHRAARLTAPVVGPQDCRVDLYVFATIKPDGADLLKSVHEMGAGSERNVF